MTRKTTTMKKMRRSIVDSREVLRSETDLVAQVEGVGNLVSTCVDALQVCHCQKRMLSDDVFRRVVQVFPIFIFSINTLYDFLFVF